MKPLTRLVVATPLYPPDLGGPATYAYLLEQELPKRGIEVEMVKFGSVRHLPKLIRHLAYFFKVLKALHSADAILALDPVSVGLPSILAARIIRKTLFLKVGGDYAWEQGTQRFGISSSLDVFVCEHRIPLPVQILRLIQGYVASRARRVIVPSKYLKNIVATWGVPEERIVVVYNGVQTETEGILPEALGASSHPRIVTVGRLVPWKGIPGLIDAVASLREEFPDISLTIVGDGPDRTTLEAHAYTNLPDRVIFTGALSHADTLAVMKNTDVFVLNSTYEGLSHLLIEAASLGLPIVATSVGGNPEVVQEGVSGLLVPPGEPKLLAHAIMRICKDSALREKLEAGALESARSFSQEAMITGTVHALQ